MEDLERYAVGLRLGLKGHSYRRYDEWITDMDINGEEHTITQSVLALERLADWKADPSPSTTKEKRLRHRQTDKVGRDRPRETMARLSNLGRR